MAFVRFSIPTRMLSNYRLPTNIQAIPFEINLRKEKWLFIRVYKPPSLNNQYFCDSSSELLDFYSSNHENKVDFVDFNLEISYPVMLCCRLWIMKISLISWKEILALRV